MHNAIRLRTVPLCRCKESLQFAIRIFSIAVSISTLAGCKRESAERAQRPAPVVTIANPVVREVIEWDEYTGRLEAVEFVKVRARVGGLVTSTPFKEGSLIKAGDLLVEIDVRPYQAELDATRAAEDRAASQVKLAKIEYDRIESIPEEARSATEFDTAAAVLQAAQAELARAKADVAAAQLNVEWCRVQAPISGRVSRRLVTPGNLISGGSGESTLLTTITSVDPVYCYVDADERSILKYAEMARTGERISARQARIPTYLQLADETGFPHEGYVDFVDNRVNPATGTISGRGVFSNSNGWLLPGLFARVRIPGSGRYKAVLVPDSAVVADQDSSLLLVVDAQHIVRPRPVKLGSKFGELRVIKEGITTEDHVIINGLMQARPGSEVKPVEGVISTASLPDDLPKTTDMAAESHVAPERGEGQ
jgi:RND family efflux transporter MFP subunit